jgi:hypothetical protein
MTRRKPQKKQVKPQEPTIVDDMFGRIPKVDHDIKVDFPLKKIYPTDG